MCEWVWKFITLLLWIIIPFSASYGLDHRRVIYVLRHQKRVRENCHYFVVTENIYYPSMIQTIWSTERNDNSKRQCDKLSNPLTQRILMIYYSVIYESIDIQRISHVFYQKIRHHTFKMNTNEEGEGLNIKLYIHKDNPVSGKIPFTYYTMGIN